MVNLHFLYYNQQHYKYFLKEFLIVKIFFVIFLIFLLILFLLLFNFQFYLHKYFYILKKEFLHFYNFFQLNSNIFYFLHLNNLLFF